MTSPLESNSGVFRSYTTSAYRLHYMETATGVRFVLLSDPKVDSLVDELSKLYSIYVDTAVKNPLYRMGTLITCASFVDAVKSFIENSKFFK